MAKQILSHFEVAGGGVSQLNPDPLFNDFFNELGSLNGNGFPKLCRKIAISNGNIESVRNVDNNGGLFYDSWMPDQPPIFGSANGRLNVLNAYAKNIPGKLSWSPTPDANDLLEFGRVTSLFMMLQTEVRFQVPFNRIDGMDIASGGYLNFYKPFGDIIRSEFSSPAVEGGGVDITGSEPNTCFVPTTSALCISDNWYQDLKNDPDIVCKTPFDEYYVPNNENQQHSSLSTIGANWLLDRILQINNTVTVASDYNFAVNTSAVLVSNIIISPNVKVFINEGVRSDYYIKNNTYANFLPIPPTNTTFNLSTNPCKPITITIRDRGLLKLGDGNRYGTLTIREGSTLLINTGGTLDIRWGSKLILEGGSLIVEQGANINLQDLESVIEIRDGGKIIIGNNANFTWTGAGYLKFNTSYGNYASTVVASSGGNGATFRHRVSALAGSGFTRKAIEITSGSMSVDQNLAEFSLIGGTVLMGSNTIADIACPMYLGGVKIKSINPGEKHGGIFVYGQQNTAYLSGCAIDDAIIGIRIFATKGTATVSTIYNSNFNNCDIGVLVYGKSTNINGGSYFGNKTGIYLSGNQSESVISNITARGNRSAIDLVGSGTDVVRIEKSNISNNSAVGGFIVNSKIRPLCSVFNNNYPSSNSLTGANILLREFAYLDAEPFGAKNAGKSSLTSDNGHAVVCVGASGIELNNGYCDYSTPNSSGLSFEGEMQGWYLNNPRQVVQANNNRWNNSGTSPVNLVDYNLDYFYAFGNVQTSLLINGSNPLSVSTNILGNCGNTLTGWGNWDNGDKPSALLNKPTRTLQDGSLLDSRFKNGLMKMYATTPNYPGVIQDLLPVLSESYSTETDADGESDLSRWFPAIELAYRTIMEALGNGIANGSIINGSDHPTPIVQQVINAQQELISYVTETYTAQEKVFQLSLDNALLYRLIHNLPLAHEKVLALNSIAATESQIALINYYDCLISNELFFSQSNPTVGYPFIPLCRTYLNMDEGDIEPFGDRPEDPIWEEGMGKTATNEQNETTSVELVSSEVSKTLVSAITVYPNPASNELTITMPSELNINRLLVTDMIGRMVHAVMIDKSESKITLPIDWENGTYLITFLSSENTISRQKVVVSK